VRQLPDRSVYPHGPGPYGHRLTGGFVSFSWSVALILLSMSLTHVHAEDAPVDANCGPRCVDFLVEYVDLPDEQLRSMITEFDALDEQPGVTFQQLAHALERRGPAISADSIPTDFMIESDAPVVLHLNPLGSNSLGHFAVLLPTSTPTHSDVWVGVEGVQSGSPLQLRPQMSGEAIAVSSKPARTAVRALSPLRIAIAENYHWFPVALPGLAIILLALLLMKLRTVPHLSQQGECLAPFNDNCPTFGDSVFGCPCRGPSDTLSCRIGNGGTTNWPNLVARLGTPVLA